MVLIRTLRSGFPGSPTPEAGAPKTKGIHLSLAPRWKNRSRSAWGWGGAQYERLTPQQERDLVIAADAGDPAADRRLVATFLPTIAGSPVASRAVPAWSTGAGPRGGRGPAGARALRHPAKTPFWGYASYWVRKAMQALVAELSRPVALSDRAVRGLARCGPPARSMCAPTGGADGRRAERRDRFHAGQVARLLATERRPRASRSRRPASAGRRRRWATGSSIQRGGGVPAVLDRMEGREVRASPTRSTSGSAR